MKEPQTREINGVTYTCTPLGTTQGLGVTARLVNMFKGMAPDSASLAKLDEKDLLFLCQTFGKLSTLDTGNGKTPLVANVFESHFEANYGELLLWVLFCVEVNFGSLFLAIVSDLPAILARFGVSSPQVSEPSTK